jgi:hypothetical protein
MANRLKEIGESAARRLMVSAGLQGASKRGYALKKRPGRGLSNTYEVTKDGATQTAALRTTRDRWVAFPPLEGGKKWKTLDDVQLVLVAAVDNKENPQNVDVYLFPADEVRKRFSASYAARVQNGHSLPDNYGMWVPLDKGDDTITTQVGHSLAIDYPAIAHFSLDELEATITHDVHKLAIEESGVEEFDQPDVAHGPKLSTVAEVLSFARDKISDLTGMPAETIKFDLKIGV